MQSGHLAGLIRLATRSLIQDFAYAMTAAAANDLTGPRASAAAVALRSSVAMWTTGQEQRPEVQSPIDNRGKRENEGKSCESTRKYPVAYSCEMRNKSADSKTANE